MTARDDLALFSAEEVAEGVSRLSTRENGEEVARLVAAIPAPERPFYRWSHEAVLLVSSVGQEVADRVRRHYGPDEESRLLIAEQQAHFGRFLSRLGEPHGGMRYRLKDVVIDVRPDAPANLVPAYLPPLRRPEPRVFLDVASEEELATALALLAPADGAREVAAQVYAIPPAEQLNYDWTHDVIMLLSCVSDEVAERIRTHLADSSEAREELARQQRSFADFLRSLGGRREGRYEVDSIVIDRRMDDWS